MTKIVTERGLFLSICRPLSFNDMVMGISSSRNGHNQHSFNLDLVTWRNNKAIRRRKPKVRTNMHPDKNSKQLQLITLILETYFWIFSPHIQNLLCKPRFFFYLFIFFFIIKVFNSWSLCWSNQYRKKDHTWLVQKWFKKKSIIILIIPYLCPH